MINIFVFIFFMMLLTAISAMFFAMGIEIESLTTIIPFAILTIIFASCGIYGLKCVHTVNISDNRDYSEVSCVDYSEITCEKNRDNPADAAYYVYLDDGSKYEINKDCLLVTNDDSFSDCFVPAGEEYQTIYGPFYANQSFSWNVLYVNQDVYDTITNSVSYEKTVIDKK